MDLAYCLFRFYFFWRYWSTEGPIREKNDGSTTCIPVIFDMLQKSKKTRLWREFLLIGSIFRKTFSKWYHNNSVFNKARFSVTLRTVYWQKLLSEFMILSEQFYGQSKVHAIFNVCRFLSRYMLHDDLSITGHSHHQWYSKWFWTTSTKFVLEWITITIKSTIPSINTRP